MSTAVETSSDAPAKRIKPNQLALILFTADRLLHGRVGHPAADHRSWENENAVHRTVFVNIPGPIQIAFYSIIPVLLVWVGIMFANRMKNWERGAPAQRGRPRRTQSSA